MQQLAAIIAQHAILISFLLVGTIVYRAATRLRPALVLDLAIVALYYRLPSAGTLLLQVALYLVRYVPTLAREVAMLVRLPDALEGAHGWTAATLHSLALFALPGLEAYAQVRAERAPARPAQASAAAEGATVALSSLQVELSLHECFAWANDDPTAPMLCVTGPSRAGKTTLILALLSRRKGDVVIVTPKAASTDPWGGFPAVRLSVDTERELYDWAPLADAVQQVYLEMLKRNARDTIPQETDLTLVIDDYGRLASRAPSVRQPVIDLVTMGASAKIRVVIVATEINVKAWGWDGQGDVRENFVGMRLEADRSATMGRVDAQGRLSNARRADTRQVLQIAREAHLSARVWSGLQAGPVMADAMPAQVAAQAQTGRQTSATDAELIAMLERGYKRREIEAALKAQGKGLDHNRLTALTAQVKAGRAAPQRSAQAVGRTAPQGAQATRRRAVASAADLD